MRRGPEPVRVAVLLGAVGAVLALFTLAWPEPATGRAAAWTLVFLLPLYAVGVVAHRLRPDLPVARLLAVTASAWILFSGVNSLAFGLSTRTTGPPVQLLAVLATVLAAVAAASAATFFLLYPNGRPVRGYERVLVATIWVAMFAKLVGHVLTEDVLAIDVEHSFVEVPNPLHAGLPALPDWWTSPLEAVLENALLVALGLLAWRYRYADARARTQIRWLLLVPLSAVGLLLLGTLLDWAGVGGAWFIAGTVGEYVTLGLVPAVLLVAILRHRLLDVDVVISRSLVFGALWAVIALTYVALATAVGLVGSQRLPVAVAIAATVAVTMAFQPVRRRLARRAEHWVYGRRIEGYDLLDQVGRSMESTAEEADLLDRVAEVVQGGLRVRWAEVSSTARAGAPRGPDEPAALTADLVLGDEHFGRIECGPRLDGEITEEDKKVLESLARQVTLALHGARLRAQLADQIRQVSDQARDLAASRARIVAAGDAERRRIERDLHDGVQQQVVALLTTLRLARNQLARDPERLATTLTEMEQEVAAMHADLVELSRGIHPAVLTDHGLVEAIRSRVDKLPLEARMEVTGLAERLPHEIEAAAYFVCSEALTNVLKHAPSADVVVRLASSEDRLVLEVQDRGPGFNGDAGAGSGLANMSDRVAALGGVLEISSEPGRGTRVRADLPAEVG